MDLLGHLNQSVYHELLEEGRAGLITEILRRLHEPVHGAFVVVRVELNYRTEVRKDHEAVDVHVWLERIGASSLTVGHDVRLPDGTVAASGQSVLVGWDPAARGKRILTDAERTALGA